MPPSSSTVLCVGLDNSAMRTRKLILEKAGYAVTQASDLRQVEAACADTSFSVVVLGQSLNPKEKRRIADVVLSLCKKAKILELHKTLTPELPEADAHLQITASQPAGLVEAVTVLARRRGKSKAERAS